MGNEPDDSELEDELRRLAARLEPVPPDLLRAAEHAFAWRGVSADVAELAFDSLLDSGQALLVRGAAEPRLLTFRSGELVIEVEVTVAAAGRFVLGQIAPPQAGLVDLRRTAGMVTVEADELGRFRAEGLPAGPLSLRLRPAGGDPQAGTITDWVTI